jgi:hypothetical protein
MFLLRAAFDKFVARTYFMAFEKDILFVERP